MLKTQSIVIKQVRNIRSENTQDNTNTHNTLKKWQICNKQKHNTKKVQYEPQTQD